MNQPVNPNQVNPFADGQSVAKKVEASTIDALHKAIVLDSVQNANRLPENIFRDYFLPVFAGLVPMDKHYEQWISIAGAPTAEVAIVDAGGVNVLFNVPALMNTDHIKRDRPEGALPFASIVSMAEAFRTKSAAASQNVITSQGLDRYKASHNSQYDYSPIEKRWIEIFKRYNIIANNEVANNASQAKAPSDAIDDDEFSES